MQRVNSNLVRMYGYVFWGTAFEDELVKLEPKLKRFDKRGVELTGGQARDMLMKLRDLAESDQTLREQLQRTGQSSIELAPKRLKKDDREDCLGYEAVTQQIINFRNSAAYSKPEKNTTTLQDLLSALEELHALLCAWQSTGVYPEVLRYEGTFENKDGELFVHFVDERGKKRKVRTDERIDPRRHYYCFATNNPIYINPFLIPKA